MSAWKAVDWETVKSTKMGFFERAKRVRSAEEMRPLAAGLRARLVKAGVPEDGVDSMVSKWVDAALKESEAPKPAFAGKPIAECAKYEEKGGLALSGCSKCAEHYPGRTDDCMYCGRTCGRSICDKNNWEECVTGKEFLECHVTCMADFANPELSFKYVLLKIEAWFVDLYRKFEKQSISSTTYN
jgi:hypothetical protein